MSNPSDQISKAAWTLAEGIKDTVIANVTTAVRTSLKMEASEVIKLLAILSPSVEEGYHRGSKVFERTVDSALLQLDGASKLKKLAKR
jgi:hypothetical protein